MGTTVDTNHVLMYSEQQLAMKRRLILEIYLIIRRHVLAGKETLSSCSASVTGLFSSLVFSESILRLMFVNEIPVARGQMSGCVFTALSVTFTPADPSLASFQSSVFPGSPLFYLPFSPHFLLPILFPAPSPVHAT